MRIKRLSLILILTLFLGLVPAQKTVASAQDFYFKSFVADYFLTRLEDGRSKLHVKEVLTAVFPDYDQNHGINREIPIYNQDKKNRTTKNQDALNITVLRNGLPEKINGVEDEGDYYNVYIGDANVYVHGEQIYTLEYDFTDVITEFDENHNNVSGQESVAKLFQELYWDTNGNAWRQSFGEVIARLHITTDILEKLHADAWCYVGKYGANGSERCTIQKTDDGVKFMAEDLTPGENLTFVVNFDAGTFEVIRDKSYILVFLLILEIVIVIFVLIKKFLRWKKEAHEQQKLYHSSFVAPQYQPPKNKFVHVAEGEQIYLKKTKSSYVATLLELAVTKSISITKKQDEKKPKKYNWSIHLNVEPSTLSPAQISMLNILANEKNILRGDDIVIQKHTATRTLANYAKNYKSNAESALNREGFLIKNKIPKTQSGIIAALVAKFFIYGMLLLVGIPTFGEIFEAVLLVGIEYLPIIMLSIFVTAVIINTVFTKQIEKYSRYTKAGIELAKYLEGLEMYIKMAEKDRLNFLQSVKGADTSNAGIVKIYEKLLPWASLFGAEKSWVKELAEYYKIEDIPEDLDINLLNGIVSANIVRDINTAVNTSISYHESSGGSGSSFSSGGGGGGFSGGGGGGGGGGGW